MTKRTPEEVHRDGGHDERSVRSCSLCQGAEPVDVPGVEEEFTGDAPPPGPLPEVDPASYPDDALPLEATPPQMVAGRPKCYVPACELPEFMDNVGLCGGHYATRPDLRKVARRG